MIATSLTAFVLASCSQSSQTVDPSALQELSDLSHIHSVATDGRDVFLATHHGLYVYQDNKWKLRGDDFDVMGLSFDNGIFYASGHPGSQQDLPDPVGVLTSEDSGNTWVPQSLTGEVDFHLLEVVDKNLIGAAASHNAVMSSADGGMTWKTLPTPNFTDMSLNPLKSAELLMADGKGLRLSKDFGSSFVSVTGPSGVNAVEWHRNFIFVATSESFYRSASLDEAFDKTEYSFNKISDIHAEGDLVVFMDAAGIHLSSDRGLTFELIGNV